MTRSLRTDGRRPFAARAGAPAGFTFLELLVVMAIMSMLLGLSIGAIKNIGSASGLKLAKTLLLESVMRTQQASHGGTLSIWTLREGVDKDSGKKRLEIRTQLAGPVLTHQFESLDTPNGYLPMNVRGSVTLELHGGYNGSAARFQGGHLEFDPQSRFAMTEGLEIEAWVSPDAGGALMTLVQGEGIYELLLVRVGSNTSYDLRLRVKLRAPGPEAARILGNWRDYETEGAPVRADGRWTRILARYDGRDASLKVNGLECIKRSPSSPRGTPAPVPAPVPGAAPTAPAAPVTPSMVIAIPSEAAVRLFVGGRDRPYRGLMDGLQLRGVFRNAENDRELSPDLVVNYPLDFPRVPVRVVFRNGRPDPDVHAQDIQVQMSDLRTPGDAPLVIEIGLHGMVTADTRPGGILPATRGGPK